MRHSRRVRLMRRAVPVVVAAALLVVVGLSVFKTQHTVNWPLQMAASLLIQLPVVALFVMTQRYFTRGIVLTAQIGGAAHRKLPLCRTVD